MAELVMLDFNREDLKLNVCYRNEALLDSIEKDSAEVDSLPKVNQVYDRLVFPPAPEHRPYTFSSVVLSADGKMAFADHPAGPVIAKNNFIDSNGALADFWILNALRAYSDGVILGAGTLQNEANNTSHIFDRDLFQERRRILKKMDHPMNIVVSFDAEDIPLDHLLFNVTPGQQLRTAIATSPQGGGYLKKHFRKEHFFVGPFGPGEEIDISRIRQELKENSGTPVFLTGEGSVPDSEVLLLIFRGIGMERLLIESPSYTSHLMKMKGMDEFFINYSMVFAGGPITPNSGSPFTHTDHPHSRLLTVATHKSSFIYTRQKLYYGQKTDTAMDDLKY